MPFESLSCTNCGSGDVQEVKPDTYFCKNCERVFKYVSPGRMAPRAGCEVLVDGRHCGIPAIGNCATDRRAFCMTHQARYRSDYAFADKCTSCYDLELQRIQRMELAKVAHEERFGAAYLQNSAVPELRAAGVSTIELLKIERVWVRRSLGRSHDEDQVTSCGTGWLLGEFEWSYNDGGSYGGSEVQASRLTALIDHGKHPELATEIYNYNLCRVENTRWGYALPIRRAVHHEGVGRLVTGLDSICKVVHQMANT